MRLALFSDIHGNREAFDACLDHAHRRGADRFGFLGDLESDDTVRLAVRKRRPLVLDHPEAKSTKNIERIAPDLPALKEEIGKTVLHEVGHYFGADEATVRGWGL